MRYHPPVLGEVPMAARRNWQTIIDRLNRSQSGVMRINMGSPGSAQVTRCRLLEKFNNLEATTVGPMLELRVR